MDSENRPARLAGCSSSTRKVSAMPDVVHRELTLGAGVVVVLALQRASIRTGPVFSLITVLVQGGDPTSGAFPKVLLALPSVHVHHHQARIARAASTNCTWPVGWDAGHVWGAPGRPTITCNPPDEASKSLEIRFAGNRGHAAAPNFRSYWLHARADSLTGRVHDGAAWIASRSA